ncbi:sensor histidine kinase [Pradoshia sp.]
MTEGLIFGKERKSILQIYRFTAYSLLILLVISIVYLYGFTRVANVLRKEAYELFPIHIKVENIFHENEDADLITDFLRDVPSDDEFILVDDEGRDKSVLYYTNGTEFKDRFHYKGIDKYLVPVLNKMLMNIELGNVYHVYKKEHIDIHLEEDEGTTYIKITHNIESDLFTGDITLYRVASITLLKEFKSVLLQCAFFLVTFILLFILQAFVMRKIYYSPLAQLRKHFSGMTKFNVKLFNYKGPMSLGVKETIDVVNQTVLELQDGVRESKSFLDEMVHEIKNPAHNIKNEIELIEDSINDEELKQSLHSVVNETENITSLLSSIKMTYNIYYLGGSPPDIWINPVEVIEPIFKYYQSKHPDWTFHFEYCLKPNVLIWIDQGSLELMIRNLLDNAIKYSTKGSSVFIGIREHREEEKVLIDVINTNSSIEYNNINKIFGKYYRTNRAKEKTVGAGIGLWIIKSITGIYEAEVSVQSSNNTTGFVISFQHVKGL